MIYNLIEFGKIVQTLRKSKGFSYNSLSEDAGIAKNTLRNIERGKVIPNLETMDLLSGFLGVDVTTLLLGCKELRHSRYQELKGTFEKIISSHSVERIPDLKANLEEILESENLSKDNSHLNHKIQQLHLRVLGHQATYTNRDDEAAKAYFIKAIQVTMPEFSLDVYEDFVYSYDELHLLFNITQMMGRRDTHEVYIPMYEFILDQHDDLVEREYYLYPLLVNNLAVAYLHIGQLDKALALANKGLRFVHEEQTTIDLPALLLCKGIILHHQKSDYADLYINLSFELLILSNRKDIAKVAVANMKKNHNIDYDLSKLRFYGDKVPETP